MKNDQRRVLIIGLDGATFDLIEPWAGKGLLPNLARLMAEGCRGRLQSTLQPTTAPAWTSFMTGVNQGKHGLYDFVRRKVDSYGIEVTNGSHISAPTLFEIASQHGKRVVSINVPFTFPPRRINGVMVSGPFATTVTRETVYPAEFFDTLQEVCPGYFISPDFDARHPNPLKAYTERLLQEIDVRERLSLHLIQSAPWDLFTVVFMATDEVQHAFWHCMDAPEDSPQALHRDAILQIYQRVDRAVEKLLEQLSSDDQGRETVTLVLSDHGFGPLRYMINLNRWLAERGFLQYHNQRAVRIERLRANGIKKFAQAYRHYVPPRLRAAIRARMGMRQFDQVKGEVESVLFDSPVDWGRTRAYTLGAGGNIFINLKGREPAGIVAPGEDYEQLRREIIESAMSLADPESQEPIVERVYLREELYQGPFLNRAPDLIIQWKDYSFWGRGRYDSLAPLFENHNLLEFTSLPLTGGHRPQGILIAQGQGIRRGEQISGAHLFDLAPTVLSLLSIPPLAEMDGHLLDDLFLEEFACQLREISATGAEQPSQQEYSYTSEEEEKISEHLRSLGYL